jgi:hypothetical protein
MTSQNWFQFVLDWVGLPSLALLAIILIYRRWYREFPFFFFYVLCAGLVGVARLFFLEEAPTQIYSRVYWVSDTALAAFAFLATYELFFKRLFSGFNKTRFYRFLFPAAAILVTSVVAGGSLIGGHLSALALTTRIFVFLQAAILVFFVALMIMMGRRWSKQEFAIAFGFGLDVSTSSILLGILSHTAGRNELLNRIAVIAYDIACLIWLYSFWDAPKVQTPTLSPPLSTQALQEAKKWEGSLKDFMSQGKR